MLKNIRVKFWFVTAFFKKYRLLIIGGLVISIILGIGLNNLQKYLPTKSVKTVYIGLVGQYSATNLPPEIISLLNSGLTSTDQHQNPVLNLAISQSIDEAKKVYTYKLKPDLSWSNGQPIKTKDINISIPKVQIETPDDQTIKFILPSRYAPFPSVISFPITNQEGLLPYPYKINLKQKTSGTLTQIIIEANFEKTVINLYPTASQALMAYKLGQIDALAGLLDIDFGQDLSKFGLINKYFNPQKVAIMVINHKDPVLSNKSTRQAIAYSFNLNQDQLKTASTTINPNSWAFNPLVKTYPANETKINDLIKDSLNLELATTPDLLPIAEQIENSINSQKINLHIKVVTSPPDNFQLLLMTLDIPQDPDQYTLWHSTQQGNISGVSNDKLDKLLEDGRTTIDQNKRKEIYQEFQRTFAEELPAITLFYPQYLNLSRNSQVSAIINSYWPH